MATADEWPHTRTLTHIHSYTHKITHTRTQTLCLLLVLALLPLAHPTRPFFPSDNVQVFQTHYPPSSFYFLPIFSLIHPNSLVCCFHLLKLICVMLFLRHPLRTIPSQTDFLLSFRSLFPHTNVFSRSLSIEQAFLYLLSAHVYLLAKIEKDPYIHIFSPQLGWAWRGMMILAAFLMHRLRSSRTHWYMCP